MAIVNSFAFTQDFTAHAVSQSATAYRANQQQSQFRFEYPDYILNRQSGTSRTIGLIALHQVAHRYAEQLLREEKTVTML